MSEPELVAAARRVRDYYTSGYSRSYGGKLYGPDNEFRPIKDRFAIADAILNPTTPAQRAAVAVLSGDTRPEVLASILDELAERFAGGPAVEPWRILSRQQPVEDGWYWFRDIGMREPEAVEVYRQGSRMIAILPQRGRRVVAELSEAWWGTAPIPQTVNYKA